MADWSAASRPTTGTDSIWIASAGHTGDVDLVNPSTRHDAWAHLDALATRSHDARALFGLDVSLAAPAGLAAALGHDSAAPWLDVWTEITARSRDDADNANNRFDVAASLNAAVGGPEGPFWGCPRGWSHPDLGPRRPAFPHPAGLAEFRACETALLATGLRPQSTWKIAYAGAVGGQFLCAVAALRERRDRGLAVFPFDTGFDLGAGTDDACASGEYTGWTVAEVWPGSFEVGPVHPIRDAAQVVTVVDAMRAADRDGTLAAWAAGPDDADLVRLAIAEEGWMLDPAASNAQPDDGVRSATATDDSTPDAHRRSRAAGRSTRGRRAGG